MKMTLLGTGVRTPFILHGLADRQTDLGLTEVVLYDSDPERLRIMTALGSHLCRTWGATFGVRSADDHREALADTRFVFSAIRVGQERARALDEEVPLRHGVLGQETTGPGGFAMALRTIPAVLGYARVIEEVAPDALVVNFTNPVGIIMQALTDCTSVRAVGVCDGPIQMKRAVAQFLGVPGDEIQVDYAGLNHCGWIQRVLVDGQDRLPEILTRYDELKPTDDSWALFDPGLIHDLGMLPMEYLYFYYYRREAIDHIRQSGGTRGQQVATLNAALWPALRDRINAGDLPGAQLAWEQAIETRHATYFARERGESVSGEQNDMLAAPDDMFEGTGYEGLATAVMTAAVQRRRLPLIVNTRNNGAIPGLRDDDVVEVTSLVDDLGAHPVTQPPLPDVAHALIDSVKAYERLTVQAAVEGSYRKATQALLAHPLVGSYPVAKGILDEYLDVHGDLLSHVRP